jgi:hypothetical protein
MTVNDMIFYTVTHFTKSIFIVDFDNQLLSALVNHQDANGKANSLPRLNSKAAKKVHQPEDYM